MVLLASVPVAQPGSSSGRSTAVFKRHGTVSGGSDAEEKIRVASEACRASRASFFDMPHCLAVDTFLTDSLCSQGSKRTCLTDAEPWPMHTVLRGRRNLWSMAVDSTIESRAPYPSKIRNLACNNWRVQLGDPTCMCVAKYVRCRVLGNDQ